MSLHMPRRIENVGIETTNGYEIEPEGPDKYLMATVWHDESGDAGSVEMAKADADRFVACWNACVGLTPEQIDAIPRLAEWAKWQDADTIGEEALDVFRPFISARKVPDA